jgi:hypothetical protein
MTTEDYADGIDLLKLMCQDKTNSNCKIDLDFRHNEENDTYTTIYKCLKCKKTYSVIEEFENDKE